MNAKIIIATHRAYQMPKDPIYLPVHVGSGSKEPLPYQPDNEGENISKKNPGFCELTGLYWAWKNLDCDYLGLAHYRRHFTLRRKSYQRAHRPADCVLSGRELAHLLSAHEIILPKKRNYYIETLYSHYAHTHYAEHLDQCREIIGGMYPRDIPSFDRVMRRRGGYMFNMFIMSKSLSDEYCEWLFPILFELEERQKGREYSTYQGRFCGRVGELLLNVWLEQRSEDICEIGCIHMEKTDWVKKGGAFLRARAGGRKYEKSF